MAVLNAQPITRAGMAPALVAADAAGDQFVAQPHTVLLVRNASAAAITVTLVTPGTTGGLAVEDPAIAVPAGADRFIGSLSDDVFRNAQGRVGVTYSAAAGVTVAVLAA